MKLQAMPGCSVLLVFFCLFVSVLFLNPASRELVPRLVSPCGLCPEELHLCPSVPPPTFAISLAITSVQGWFVLTFFFCFFVCFARCWFICCLLGEKAISCWNSIEFVLSVKWWSGWFTVLGFPCWKRTPVLPSGAGFLVGGQRGGTSANLAGRLSEVPL